VDIPILQPPVIEWECSMCPAQDVTREARPHTRFHNCPAVGGALLPMTVKGAGARVVLREREDYIGTEQVQMINERPVMSAVTEHADGRVDASVYVPTATAGGSV
jgi:hypothetical protein